MSPHKPGSPKKKSKKSKKPQIATPAHTLEELDASRYLGFTVAWLRVRRRDGKGPAFVRAGRLVRYRVVDLDAWLLAHTVPTRWANSSSRPLTTRTRSTDGQAIEGSL